MVWAKSHACISECTINSLLFQAWAQDWRSFDRQASQLYSRYIAKNSLERLSGTKIKEDRTVDHLDRSWEKGVY